MKKILLLAALFIGFRSINANAAITVTPGGGGINICSNLAVGGTTPAFTTLGNITVTEGLNADITLGFHALVINAPAGWQFNTATPPTYSFTAGRNIISVTQGAFSATSLTVNIIATGTTLLDAFNIIGLQVQATSTASAAGNITASAAPGMAGITVGVTNFGGLSLQQAPSVVTVTGGGTFCNNTTLNASITGLGTIFYQDVQFNGTSTATPSTSQLIVLPGTNTYYFRARTGAACWGPQGSAKVTINTAPSGLAVTPPGASFCMGDSVTVIASATSPNVELLQEDFNAGLGAWTITNTTGNATSWFQVRNSPGYNGIVAGDGSPYVQAAPDGAGGVTTETILTSPSFSTVGYTAATLTFNQYFQTWVNDTTVAVEYSTDGTVWTPFIDQLGATTGAFTWLSTTPNTTMALPAGALGQPTVWLRWNYRSFWGWYWAVDNISVQATPTLSYTWTGLAGATGLSCTTCDTVTIIPAAAGVNSYSVATSVSGCAVGVNLDLTVNALPAVYNVTGGGAYCAGGAGMNVGLDNSELGVDYQLFNGASTVGAPMPGTGLPIDFGPQTAAGTYTVMATNATTFCAMAMNDSAIITIDTLPGPISGPSMVCEGSTITLTVAAAGGAWSSSDITIATVVATGDVTGVMAGAVDITYSLPTTCFVTYPVVVNPLPVVSAITGTTDVCVGSTTALTSATLGGTWASDDGSIATVDAAGLVTGVAAGATDITYTVTDIFGCAGIASTIVSVSATPAATIMPAGTYVTMCQGNPDNLVGTIIPGATYQWSMDGSPIAGATNHNYIATTPGVYTLDMSFGACAWTLPSKTVLPDPHAVISYNSTGNYIFTGSFTTYQWYRNGTAITGSTSSLVLSPTPGNYHVIVTDITGCLDTSAVYTIASTGINTPVASVSVKVYPNPSSSAIYIDAPVKVNVTVISPDGRVVIPNATTNSLNVSNLANGVYIMQVFDENNTLLKTERFSKID